MGNLVKYLNCGRVIENGSKTKFYIAKFSDILSILIPLFEKYPILGVKAKDFEGFREITELMKKKEHLNLEGLSRILKIKGSMNKSRVVEEEGSCIE
jgi:hypothetical protein